MPFKNRICLTILVIVIVALAAVLLAPIAVSNGVRLWVWGFGRKEGFVATIDGVDAPFLRPIVIRQIHLKSARDNAVRVDVTVLDARVGLNLKHVFLHLSGRDIRNISVREFHAEVHRTNPSVRALSERGWATLHRLLPESLSIAKLETRVENGPSLILLRNASLSVSETEPGRFTAAELMVTSPWVRQTFSQLRGATHWEGNRLTLAGLTLTHGLDLQAVTVDFARLANRRMGLEFDVDAFGGKLRANISHEWHSPHSNWKIAGGAADLSLAQISDALGFADRVNGLLHARNFGGSLAIEGASLTFFKYDIDSFRADVTLKPSELEIERFDLARKKDSLSGEGKIDLSPEHKYSGTLDAWTNDLRDYVSTLRGSPRQKGGGIPVEFQATIDSSQWDTRGMIHLPKSSPLSFTASFPLPIGITWSAFQMSPLKVSLDFPALFLAAAPQLFLSNILEYGIFSGKISLSEQFEQ